MGSRRTRVAPLVTIAWLFLGALAAAILLFSVALFVSRRILKHRLANVAGPYLVRIGLPGGRGRDGDDLDTTFETLEEARQAATAALLTHEDDAVVAFVLGQRDDQQWDVIDRVDVLTP